MDDSGYNIWHILAIIAAINNLTDNKAQETREDAEPNPKEIRAPALFSFCLSIYISLFIAVACQPLTLAVTTPAAITATIATPANPRKSPC